MRAVVGKGQVWGEVGSAGFVGRRENGALLI